MDVQNVEPSVAAQNAAEWKKHVSSLVESGLDEKDFLDHFLRVVLEITTAQGVIAWSLSSRPSRILGQSPTSFKCPRVADQNAHQALLKRVAEVGKPIVVKPRDREEGASVNSSAIILAPFSRGGEKYVVEVFFSPAASRDEYSQSLAPLFNICNAVSKSGSSKATSAKESSGGAVLATQRVFPPGQSKKIDKYAFEVHASLDVLTTCYSIANQAKSLLECERVSVAKFSRGKCNLAAISGQVSVNRRSNAVRFLESLATAVLKTGEVFWYPAAGHQAGYATLPQIEKPLHDYLLESSVRTIAIIPIFDPPLPDELLQHEPSVASQPTVVGAMIIEHFTRDFEIEDNKELVQIASRHGGAAFRNAIRHHQLFLYPLWHWLGRTRLILSVRNLPKLVMLGAIALVAALILILLPVQFSVSASGVLVPELRRQVFTQVDGVIDKIHIGHGSMVEEGQTLAEMQNDDLAIRRERIVGEIDMLRERIQSIDGLSLRRSRSEAEDPKGLDISRLERQSLSKRIESLERQKELVDAQLENLTVTSPIKGQVITWNVDERLLSRPVAKGKSLLEVADVDGPWVVELYLPDRRIGYVKEAQQKISKDLRVSFILAADPKRKFEGRVVDLSTASEVDPKAGLSVRVLVQIESPPPSIRQMRTDVSAKIHCGKRSLGFIWFHDAIEFVNSHVLFHLG